MMQQSIQSIPSTVGFCLAQLCKAHRSAVEAELKKHGMHAGQEMILLRLWHEDGLSQSQLAERLCVEPPTITKMIRRMEQEGLIERRADDEDARVMRAFLTPRSRELQATIEAAWHAVEARLISDLSPEERMLFRRLLIAAREGLRSE